MFRVPDGAIASDWAAAGRTTIAAAELEPSTLVFNRPVARKRVVVAVDVETIILIPNGNRTDIAGKGDDFSGGTCDNGSATDGGSNVFVTGGVDVCTPGTGDEGTP